jgi:hypothetical protein
MYCLKRGGIISPYVLFKQERNYLPLCTVLKGKELSPLMYCLKRRGIIPPYVLFKKGRNYLPLCTV